MRVTHFKKELTGSHIAYSADFIPSRPGLKKRIFFRVPRAYDRHDFPYDAFFVAAVPMAMALQEDLQFEATVSERLFRILPSIKKYINEPQSSIRISVSGTLKRKKTSSKNGLFFTLGVDSTHSLIASKRLPKKDQVDFLLFMNGSHNFELPVAVTKTVYAKIRNWSRLTKTRAIIIETNVRKLADNIINWDYFHGAAIAAAAHLVSPYIGKMYISNHDGYGKPRPSGTGIEIDKMWSTEGMKFESIFPSYKRLMKISEIIDSSQWNRFKQDIWVCTHRPKSAHMLNCGRCEKCIKNTCRFMIIAGKKKALPFPKLKPSFFIKLEPETGPTTGWVKIYQGLKEKNLMDEKLSAMISAYIARRFAIEKSKKRREQVDAFKKGIKKALVRLQLLNEVLYLKNNLQRVYVR